MSLRSNNIWLSYNRAIENWTRNTWLIQSQMLQAAVKNGTDKLVASLGYKNKRDQGMIDYAGFSFDRTGIFIEKGVGGVYKVNPKGSGIVVRTTQGEMNRKPHPWLEPSIDGQLAILTNIVSEEFAKVASGVGGVLEKTVNVKGIN
jgi:hypothetical protein